MKMLLWSFVSLLTLVAAAQTGFADEGGNYDEIKIERIKYKSNSGWKQFKCGEQYDSSYWKSCEGGYCRSGNTAFEALNDCRKYSNNPEKCSKPIKIHDTSVYRCD